MKKVISITIGKVVFNVEEDAYNKLDDYLTAIRRHFSKDKAREEILEDIEISIAEKFLERKKREDMAISMEDVSAVIAQMGTVADFGTAEETDEEEETVKPTKKLYRDPDDKIIAGVASGLAAYFGIETVLMRLIFFIAIFFGGVGIVAYIVLWIIMPVAETTAQKMEMRGERVTLKQIEKSIKDGVETLKKKDFGRVTGGINKGFQVMGKIVMAFLHFLRVLVGLGILLAGISGVFALSFGLAWMLSGGELPWTDIVLGDFISVGPVMYWIFLVAIYLIVMVPMLILFLLGLSILRKKNMVHTSLLVTVLVLWFAACGVSGSVVFKNAERIKAKVEELEERGRFEEKREAKVYFYVNSVADSVENIEEKLLTVSAKLIEPPKSFPDEYTSLEDVVQLRIRYPYSKTEDLIKILSTEATNKVVFSEKTMWEEKGRLSDDAELTVIVDLVPVTLLPR